MHGALASNESGVSPVIGIVLMIVITVLLAATISSYAMGLAGTLHSPPMASFSIDFDAGDDGHFEATDGDDTMTVTHVSGDSISAGSVTILVGDDVAPVTEWHSRISAGESERVTDGEASLQSGETVRIVWTSADGQSSTNLATAEIP